MTAGIRLEIPDKLNCSSRKAECVRGREDVCKTDTPSAAEDPHLRSNEARGTKHNPKTTEIIRKISDHWGVPKISHTLRDK